MNPTVIEFNGVKSSDLGLVVERVGSVPIPKRKIDRYSIPGRNGDLLVSQNAWQNVTISYDVYIHSTKFGNVSPDYAYLDIDSVQHAASVINKWLFSPDGYQQLRDSNDPLYYREAFAVGDGDIENILRKFGRVRISFDCKPQRYRILGTYYSDLSQSVLTAFGFIPLINNVDLVTDTDPDDPQVKGFRTSEPQGFGVAHPYIIVMGTQAGDSSALLSVNNEYFSMVNIPLAGLFIDTDRMVVTNFLRTQIMNDRWIAPDFPVLRNEYSYENMNHVRLLVNGIPSGQVAGYICPRWWTL